MGLNEKIVTAVKKGDLALVRSLREEGADLFTTASDTSKKRTLLHHAAQRGHRELVCYLVSNNLNLDSLDQDYKTPIYYAIEDSRLEIVKLLVELGASLNLVRNNPLYRACECSFAGPDIVEHLLKSGADFNLESDAGQTPLFGALNQQNTESAGILLQLGANPNHENLDGVTPLIAVAHQKSPDHLEQLLKHEVNVNAINRSTGETALHIAALYGRTENISLLLDFGADKSLRNKKNETALEIAERVGKVKPIKLLAGT
ncbi:MAG: ankyrin repeat domain-containing protein [Verrucomicrobiota bacterium]